MKKPLFDSNEWTMKRIQKTMDAIERIATEKYQIDYYAPQVEIISSDQMLNAMCSHAMPIMYNHWSFGKEAARLKSEFDNNKHHLAYEVVINTDPCIAYLMENNTMVMQATVLAHASIGHSTFFKNNYMFKEHTNSKLILDYLRFAKNYVAECELKYGRKRVEDFITHCHALQYQSVDRYKRKYNKKQHAENKRRELDENERVMYDPTLKPIYNITKKKKKPISITNTPEDNLLYFVEKNSIVLEPWEKEIVRIIRKISQYFYPQILTKTMNEGTATFWEFLIMEDLSKEGLLTQGQYLEFLKDHSNIIYQPMSLNPYTLGFTTFMDIKRICENPTEEDKVDYPDIAGSDWLKTIKNVIADYKDSTFIHNFLTKESMKKMKLWEIEPTGKTVDTLNGSRAEYEVMHTHDADTFKEFRGHIASRYEWDNLIPTATIVHHDPSKLTTKVKLGKPPKGLKIDSTNMQKVMRSFATLMGTVVKVSKFEHGSTEYTVAPYERERE